MSEAPRDRFRLSAEQLLAQARCRLKRLSPEQAHATEVIGGFQAWKAAGLPVRAAQVAASTSDGSRVSSVAHKYQPIK